VLQPAEAAGRPAACAAAPPPPQPPQVARVRPQAPAARAGSRGEEPAAGCDAEAARRRGRRLLSVDSSRSAGDPGERASSGTGAAGESAGWRASVAGAHAPGGAAEAGLDQMMAGLQPAGAARGKAWPAPAGGAAGRDGGQGKAGFWQPPMAGSSEAKLSLLGKADRDEARRAGGAKSPARGSLFWLRFKDAALERQYTRYLSEQQLQARPVPAPFPACTARRSPGSLRSQERGAAWLARPRLQQLCKSHAGRPDCPRYACVTLQCFLSKQGIAGIPPARPL